VSDALPVLVLDDHFVIVAKPSGMPVHRSFHVRVKDVALQRVRNQMKRRVNPVHRLDQPTSGCLIFAFGKRWTARLHSSLRHPSSTKTYLAFVRGCWPHEGPITVDSPMKGDDGEMKEARSVIECLGRSDEPRCSLLRVTPQTGRFHQVRRHVRDMHHPVIGDSSHGDTRINRWWREEYGLHRLGLHCLAMDLPHPTEERRIVATCPVADELRTLWARLPWWDDALAAEPRLALSWDRVDEPG
jgi:tRNA pseudouridine65 synthase